MTGFRLLRRARSDVLDIAAFTADRWGEDQAERYLTGLYSRFQRSSTGRSYGDRFRRSRPTSGRSSASMPCSTD
jgi:plasmid stabilization system protein ParE